MLPGSDADGDGEQPPQRGRRSRADRARSDRLDDLLAQYRDDTYATWTPPDGPADVTPLGDRRIIADLRTAPKPTLPNKRLRYGAAAVGTVAASALAVTVALSTLGEPGTVEPDNGILLAAASPGGDRGALTDHAALQRCLDAARIPTTKRIVLGAGPIDVRGTSATVLLLPGPALGDLTLLAVTPTCAQGTASSVLVTRTLAAAARTATAPARTP
ncbi:MULTISPECIES: hypothetical protein [Tsukamurella]|uniref:Anti-sigma-M factor RsmA n=1 Tax=Tsukamurella strandjordii TaxID=147577 RepID=A0AA90SS82_9ACTN|nr:MULTISPECIES: hypothetical protein [Tsukamurella]MDP0399621.1 hypothetical protein [Tsukamurella strandjordii]GIZ97230.1 hypothetical protein TTY48_18420 [Tsukamurella sp. TY48]